jgi:hypothetical protein
VTEAVSDLDTKTIPEGGTNISALLRLPRRASAKAPWEIAR